MSCESWETNAPYDVVPFPTADNHMNPIALYLGEKTEEYLTHPYASPLFGDFKGLPPVLIQAGDAEVLRDEAKLLAYKASCAGVQVMHELYEDAVRFSPLRSSTYLRSKRSKITLDSCVSGLSVPGSFEAIIRIDARFCPNSPTTTLVSVAATSGGCNRTRFGAGD